MSKLQTLATLPPALPAQQSAHWQQALGAVQNLEQTLIRFDQTMARAINRLMDQGDAIALEITPLLTLRQQLADQMTALVLQSKQSCAGATEAASAAEQASKELREAARLLANASENRSKTKWRGYGAVAILSVGLQIALLKVWPALAIHPVLQVDTSQSAQQIAIELSRIAIAQRRALAARDQVQ